MGPESAEPDDRLESWKAIAAYLKHSERTVRRWEATEGLPVHRHIHERRGSVYAFRAELDSWFEQRSQPPSVPEPTPAAESQVRFRRRFWVLASSLVAVACLLTFRNLPARMAAPNLVPLTTYPGSELDVGFSPDASQIVFAWNGDQQDNYDIYTRPLAQDRPVRLTSDPAEEFGPVWSPDGRTIAFVRREGEHIMAVMAVPASGGPVQVLARFFYEPRMFTKFRTRFLAWRPKSRQLAVAGRNSVREPHTLWSIDEDGRRRRLTTPPRESNVLGDLAPAYAPDGGGLLFSRGNTRFTSELYLLRLDKDGVPAGEPEQVTSGMHSANTPVWVSKDRVVFHRSFENGLWTVSLKGGRATPIGFARWWAEMPAFSAEANRLAYSSGRQEFDIWSLDLGAPERRQRVVASTHREVGSSLSHDGSRLTFASDRSGSAQVWVSRVNGQDARRLTELEGRTSGDPRWSPDGRWIAFESRSEGRADVFATRADGSGLRQLTTDAADDLSVNWSRNGEWVYFSSNRGGTWEVWKTHWETGREVRMTTGGGLGAAESPDGRYVYYVKPEPNSGYGFLSRMPVQGGREERVVNEFRIAYRGFSVLDDMLYFISDDEQPVGSALYRLDLKSPALTRVTQFGRASVSCPDITMDGRRMFYTLAEQPSYDLVAVEQFR